MTDIINFRRPINFNGIPVVVFNRHKIDQFGGYLNWHKEIEIIYLKTGVCRTFINGTVYTLNPGDIAIANSNEPHNRLWFYGDCHFSVIQIDPDSFVYNDSTDLEQSNVGKVSSMKKIFQTIIHDEELTHLFTELTDSYASIQKSPSKGLMTISNLYKFYSYLIDNYCVDKVGSPMVDDANSDYVRFTLDFINENFASNIKIGDIADDLHISKTYLSSVFSKTTGVTISTYLNEIRCRNAMIFIKNGMPVTKAAYAVGYNDAAYFSRIFKKLKGYPPSEISEHM